MKTDILISMRSDLEMPMVEDVCRLQWLDARTCPIVSVALVRAHLPWWQQLIHRFHVWQRNECYLQIIITMSMHRADNVIYRNKCKINSKIEKRAFLLLLWPKWGSCLGLQMSPNWTFRKLSHKFYLSTKTYMYFHWFSNNISITILILNFILGFTFIYSTLIHR